MKGRYTIIDEAFREWLRNIDDETFLDQWESAIHAATGDSPSGRTRGVGITSIASAGTSAAAPDTASSANPNAHPKENGP